MFYFSWKIFLLKIIPDVHSKWLIFSIYMFKFTLAIKTTVINTPQ